uniref:Putative secreted peptide n=1 Tax=Anopheles braziliensis TaxID=58242 RepID=A0A2M3ZVZ8_9DIPT
MLDKLWCCCSSIFLSRLSISATCLVRADIMENILAHFESVSSSTSTSSSSTSSSDALIVTSSFTSMWWT